MEPCCISTVLITLKIVIITNEYGQNFLLCTDNENVYNKD